MWRVYYDDGSTYTGDAYTAPAWGVLVIVEADADHGRRLVSGSDYYGWENSRWWGFDFIGLVDYLARSGPRKVLFGRLVDNDHWTTIFNNAYTDPEFAPKTAWGVFERRVSDG